jgi:DNA-binding NarL/FixJ family response regulator
MQGNALILGPNVAPKVVSQLRSEGEADDSDAEPIDFGKVLTGREMDVFRILAEGKTNQEIAEELCLTEGTVKNYISKVIQNTGARDRMQAVIWSQKYAKKLRSADN